MLKQHLNEVLGVPLLQRKMKRAFTKFAIECRYDDQLVQVTDLLSCYVEATRIVFQGLAFPLLDVE